MREINKKDLQKVSDRFTSWASRLDRITRLETLNKFYPYYNIVKDVYNTADVDQIIPGIIFWLKESIKLTVK